MRRADVSFIRGDRYSFEQLSEDGITTIPPDLAVEVVSPNDLVDELDKKVEEYLQQAYSSFGSYDLRRAVQVFRSDRSESWLWAADELSGEDVLPGFRCKLDDLFPNPSQAPLQRPNGEDAVSPSPAS